MGTSEAQVWTIESILRWTTDDLRARGIETPRLDAELLLGHATGLSRVELIVDAKRPLTPDELDRFRGLVQRRRRREPVAYLRGHREFFGRPFRVDARVLVPRPETELLVEVALRKSVHLSLAARTLDLCTGSGCVAITLARERPTTFVFAVDRSDDALVVARENALRLGAYNVAFLGGDLFAPLPSRVRFDLLTANAPYIPASELATLQPEVARHEPRLALDGGDDGLAILRRLIAAAPHWLAPGGVIALEIGSTQGAAVSALLIGTGFVDVETTADYARLPRVVSGRLPHAARP